MKRRNPYPVDNIMQSNLHSFGMLMKERTFSSGDYRFGFNGKEKTDEVNGEGTFYDYGFRIYNPNLGKFLSVDPLSNKFSWWSPYAFAGNSALSCIDLDGLEPLTIQRSRPFQNYLEARKAEADARRGAVTITTYTAIRSGVTISTTIPTHTTKPPNQQQPKVILTQEENEIEKSCKAPAVYRLYMDIQSYKETTTSFWDNNKFISSTKEEFTFLDPSNNSTLENLDSKYYNDLNSALSKLTPPQVPLFTGKETEEQKKTQINKFTEATMLYDLQKTQVLLNAGVAPSTQLTNTLKAATKNGKANVEVKHGSADEFHQGN